MKERDLVPQLRIRGGFRHGDVILFEGLDLVLEAGQWTCLLGPSGVGKSTLLRLVAGLNTGGEFDGSIESTNSRPLREQVAYMAQSDLLLPWLNVRANVMLGSTLRGEVRMLERADQLIDEVGLGMHAQKRPHELSGGMRQRAALARTLMEDKPLLLLDEPFSALDARTRSEMQELAFEVLMDRTVMLVTHDPSEAARIAHRVYLLTETGLHQPGFTGRPPMPYILPGPLQVASATIEYAEMLGEHTLVTLSEVLIGLFLGTVLGAGTSLFLVVSGYARRLLLPLMVFSQTVPIFALAPLLTLWLGYGMGSKIAMTLLIIYFPVASTFYDGLRNTPKGYLDLALTMNASESRTLFRIQVPAALPSLASGLRLAAVYAPIGAVIGEWVGASRGLGYLMLLANGRVKIDLMFAALFALAALTITLHTLVNHAGRRLTRWSVGD